MATLIFFTGTMDCGKSTLALQMDHNHAARGRKGLIFSCHDRGGREVLTSRLGLAVPAIEVTAETNFWDEVVSRRTAGARVDYLVCDEAQFYTVEQVDQLVAVVDELDADVFAFGITTDFRTRLFEGTQRLVEMADRIEKLQVEALCWCGERATHNARTVGGVMVVEGDQLVVGDTAGSAEVAYEVLCRRHHVKRLTAVSAGAQEISPTTLIESHAELADELLENPEV